eukprot:gene5819-15862_t
MCKIMNLQVHAYECAITIYHRYVDSPALTQIRKLQAAKG